MTVMSSFPRLVPRSVARSEELIRFPVDGSVSLSALANWQNEPTARPLVVIVHGLTGHARSGYSYGMAEKVLAAGMNSVRLNLRGCGDGEYANPEIYHAGVSPDLRAVLEELRKSGHSEIYVVGFSLGGNVALKLAGELCEDAAQLIAGIVAISAPIDLAAACDSLRLGRMNRFYQYMFLRNLRSRVKIKHRLHPERIPIDKIDVVRTLRDFDNEFTAPLAGYGHADNYYSKASALTELATVRIPSLLIHARDDTFVPFASFERAEIEENPQLVFLPCDHGGHAGFIGSRASAKRSPEDRGVFWAENRAIAFFRALAALRN